MATEVEAIFRLSEHRKRFPELYRVLAQSRLELAVAILTLDGAAEPAILEQAAVEKAIRAHAAALADLIRGQQDSSIPEET